ncbi:MAG: TrkH family potassium uptake protein [Pararhodobacter sp.]|nr:TrkH family potassium uptake protein [Pararhodobacter sp.]
MKRRVPGPGLADVPLLTLLICVTGALMLIPAAHGFLLGPARVGRAFLHSGLVFMLLGALLALATARPRKRRTLQGLFPMLSAIYLVLPAVMAVPLAEALPAMRFADAWFEMISSFTTTGASVIDTPGIVPETVHLWRAMAGWLGGLFMLAAATALLAPIGLGGFELLRPPAEHPLASDRAGTETRQTAVPRFVAHLRQILPLYAGLTGLLWALLTLAGMAGFPAAVVAMSVLSTSGILPRHALGDVGLAAEIAIFVFFFLALSRAFMPGAFPRVSLNLRQDPQPRMALAMIAAVTVLVVLRHWAGGHQPIEGETLPALGQAAWGAAFTGLSFLTTTGIVNDAWIAGRAWSGLQPPGLVLLALALMGGGVATTAGGVKLLRIYALGRMGGDELRRLIFPSSVASGGERARFLSGRGAHAAWLFLMVFAAVACLLVATLLVLGMSFETAIIFAAAALSTTGQLAQYAGDSALHWSLVSDPARAVLALGMILGRLEILVLLALLSAQLARE